MPGLGLGIHVFSLTIRPKTWMAGTFCTKTALRTFGPAMTGGFLYHNATAITLKQRPSRLWVKL
jgi:hypothetical protein